MLGFTPIAATPLGATSALQGLTFEVDAGSYAVSYQGAGKLITDVAPTGVFTLDGRAVDLTKVMSVAVGAGAFTLTGQDAGSTRVYAL